MGHSEECRKRILEELTKLGDDRITRENQRWFEYLTEEENTRQKRPDEEDNAPDTGIGEQRAASASGAAASPEIARSIGGAPAETETRTPKRKAEEETERQIEMRTEEAAARGVKISIGESMDDWEDYAKMPTRRNDQRVTEKS